MEQAVFKTIVEMAYEMTIVELMQHALHKFKGKQIAPFYIISINYPVVSIYAGMIRGPTLWGAYGPLQHLPNKLLEQDHIKNILKKDL
jgi:hypothetical protein